MNWHLNYIVHEANETNLCNSKEIRFLRYIFTIWISAHGSLAELLSLHFSHSFWIRILTIGHLSVTKLLVRLASTCCMIGSVNKWILCAVYTEQLWSCDHSPQNLYIGTTDHNENTTSSTAVLSSPTTNIWRRSVSDRICKERNLMKWFITHINLYCRQTDIEQHLTESVQ